jgi:hypothetical protein
MNRVRNCIGSRTAMGTVIPFPESRIVRPAVVGSPFTEAVGVLGLAAFLLADAVAADSDQALRLGLSGLSAQLAALHTQARRQVEKGAADGKR